MATEPTEISVRDLREMVFPSDNPDNIANHFCVARDPSGSVSSVLGFTHHFMTLGVKSDVQDDSVVKLSYIHYTTPSPSLKVIMHPIFQGFISIAEVKICEATLQKVKNDKRELTDLHILSDDGEMLKNCKEGKISRVKRDSYPTSRKERISAKKRAEARVGELSYKASLNNCDHFVTEVLTGEATCHQLENAGLKMFAATTDELNEKAVRFLLNACYNEIKQVAASFFSTGLDDLVEYTGNVSATAKYISGFADRNKINLKSIALIELAFLIIFTIRDIFLYMRDRKNARRVAQDFIRNVAGIFGTCAGTSLVGSTFGVIFAFFGWGHSIGVTIGNIVGGIIGGVLANVFGTDWLLNSDIEKLLVSLIEGGIPTFADISERLSKIMELFKGLVPVSAQQT